MAVPACQQQQEEHGEKSSGSWRNIFSQRAATAARQANRQPNPWIFFRRRRRHGRQRDSAARPTPNHTFTGTDAAPAPADGGGADPLSLPAPEFSAAVKVLQQGASFILASQTTGRRWRTISSSRECQFGEVLRAVELTEGAASEPSAYFAIKELSLKKLRQMKGRTHEDPLQEVAALQYVSNKGHPNVLTCTEALRDKDNLYIVTPFYGGGEVFEAVTNRGRFQESEARPLFRQALEGLLHLKRRGVCHRDVSLENLLLDEEGIVKLIDFGLALRIPQTADGAARVLPHQGRCGKQYYMSPEVVAPTSAGFDGFAVDVWACGILLFIMLTGVPPFEIALPSQDRRCEMVAVEERLGRLLSAWGVSLSSDAVCLIQSCLLSAPGRRPSLETLLKHPWMNA